MDVYKEDNFKLEEEVDSQASTEKCLRECASVVSNIHFNQYNENSSNHSNDSNISSEYSINKDLMENDMLSDEYYNTLYYSKNENSCLLVIKKNKIIFISFFLSFIIGIIIVVLLYQI
tara:strand:- start:749 stop:1102 length:354 start_codon:yes stop_codon:yes gene_type:complete